MDNEFHELRESLRSEKCPPEVIARVHRAIEKDRSNQAKIVPVWFGAVGLAAILVLSGLMVWVVNKSPVHPLESPSGATVAATNEIAAKEAFLSLSYVGSVVLETGQQVKVRFLDEAGDPIKEQYLTTKEYLINKL